MRDLKGRVAVITGAASGIGQALAEQLHREGCKLALVDVNAERLEAVCASLSGSSLHRVDVSDRAAMAALPEQVLQAHGAVHLLVNNAGVTVNRPFEEHTLDDWDWLLGINLWGVIYGCHFFLPHLMKADQAHIVNISSIFGVVGVPTQSSYCTAKFGVRGLSEVLWEELDHTHVGVTVVHPGGVDTRIVSEGRQSTSLNPKHIAARFKKMSIPPDAAARQILRAIQRNRRRCVITKEAYLMDWLKRLAPETGNRWVAHALVRALGMTEQYQARIEDYRLSRSQR